MQCQLIAALSAELAGADAHLSGKYSDADSGAARVNTPVASVSVPFAVHCYRVALM